MCACLACGKSCDLLKWDGGHKSPIFIDSNLYLALILSHIIVTITTCNLFNNLLPDV